jgi:hypothetical protein
VDNIFRLRWEALRKSYVMEHIREYELLWKKRTSVKRIPESVGPQIEIPYVRWRGVIMIVDGINMMRVLWSILHSSVYNRGV